MEDYREIGPPGNGKTRKTGASNLAAVRETTRPVRIHASRVIFRGAHQSFKVLTANAQQRTHCFFIFGHSLGENDHHIFRRLGRGRFKKLYVGIFGDLNSDGNREIIRRATAFAAERKGGWPLEVAFFDSASANVWGGTA